VRRPPTGASLTLKTPPSVEVLVRPDPCDHPPARLRPSEVEGRGDVRRIERLGPTVPVHGDVDPLSFGSAVHAFLAADSVELDEEDRRELGARILDGWGVAAALALDDLLQLSQRFSRWLSARWPGGRIRREWPVEHRLPEGTVVRGKIDVFVQAESTLALIDHKVIMAGEARALEAAAGYAGQLTTYANALVAANIGGEVEMVIHLPLSGLVAYVGDVAIDITAPPPPSAPGT
jgi:ATP-dependent helicase/nuclease subunit A